MVKFSANPSIWQQALSTWIRPFARLTSHIFSLLFNVFSAKIRILPLVIFCASMLFTVKVSQLFLKTNSSESIIDFKMANAAPDASTSQKTESASTPASKNEAAKESDTSPLPSVNLEESASDSHKNSVKFSEFDPLKMSAHEFKVLQELSNRETQLNQQQNQKGIQESTLKAIEEQIQKKAEALNQSQKKLEDLLNKTEVQEDTNIVRLAKVAENMKAKEAAKILEGVKFEVLIEIMEKIKEAKISAILSNMEPEKASYLMTELALRKKIFKKDDTKKAEAAPAA